MIAPARITVADSEHRAAAMLGESFAGARRPLELESRVITGQGFALGWTGKGEPNAFDHEYVACVMDGSFYNRDELGDGRSDAEAFARLYLDLGADEALRQTNGDFAIALYDKRSRTLLLARDRFGVRPLYFADGCAASRPRPLLLHAGVTREPSRTFLALFAGSHYRYFDNDMESSPYEHIAQVAQAQLIELRAGDVTRRTWWSLDEQPDYDESPDELAERYRELILDAVGKRVHAGATRAFTLSGGLDSSTVTAAAVRVLGEKQHAFSSVYSGSEYDESDEIRTMLDAAVEQWHPVRVDDPDVVELVGQMVATHDEPVATATWLSHHVVCGEVVDAGFDALFGGLGGDELNAGEYEYFIYRFADLRAAGREDDLRREVAQWKRHHDHPIFRKDWDVMEDALRRFVDVKSPGTIRPDRSRLERYNDALDPELYDLREFEPVLDRPFTSYLKNRTYQDIFRETAPCCLRAEDRQTAAHGVRNVDPFFDHRLTELMFRVPGELKIQDGVTKQLLRRATVGLLPEETRTRIKKTGWNAPANDWFAGDGRELLLDLVRSEPFRGRGIYNLSEVERLVDEHDEIVRSGEPRENHMMFLWQLVNLELWLRWLDEL